MAERRRIPIYDAAAPIACTITEAEIPARIELLRRMRDAMSTLERTSTGLQLHFPDEPAIRGDLATFVVDEKRCCQFWGFDVLEEATGLALRWDAPPDADDLLRRIETFFTTDAPLTLLDGLL